MGRGSSNHSSASVQGAGEAGGAPVRILAIDYGRRRIGLAISDAMGWSARPLVTLPRKGRAADLGRLQKIAQENGVGRVIVGHPLRMNGTRGEMAEEAARFAQRVGQALALPVELVDERLTSWAARQSRNERGQGDGARSDDEIAAAILLQEYLDRAADGGE